MYESYYGFAEKPFSLTPDPKYLYRSQSHANAFDLLQYAIRRREGFVVITGDIGTGKTTLCRALLEQIDRTTFTALVLNPFMTEEDLLRRILQDFGVISREEVKAGRIAHVTKQELIETLYDFLLGLVAIKASAVLIIDEAQNLPLAVLEQIRILSNLETDKEKLLQIILVGQLNLGPLQRERFKFFGRKIATVNLLIVLVMHSDVPKREVVWTIGGKLARIESDSHEPGVDFFSPVGICFWIGRFLRSNCVVLNLAQTKRQPGIFFKLFDGARASQTKRVHALAGKQFPDFAFAPQVLRTPLNPGLVGFRVIVPMLDGIFANVVVPDDGLARVKEVVAVGKSTQRHRGFFA